MTKIETQISKLEQRLQEKPDPLLADAVESLKKLQKLDTIEGLIECHQRHFCSTDEAAEKLGVSYITVMKRIENFFKPKGKRKRKEIAAVQLGTHSNRKLYAVVKKSLKGL